MKIIALISVCGGAGKTSLTSALAVLLARRGHPVVALELDSQNMLATFLGLPAAPSSGFATRVLEGADPWSQTTYRNDDGVIFVPFGDLAPDQLLHFENQLGTDPGWLAARIAQIDLADHGIVLLDAARFPGVLAAQAVLCADHVLCLTRPEPLACATLARHVDSLRGMSRRFSILANGVHPALPVHYDALALLRARVGPDLLMSLRVHQDQSLPESYARGRYCFDEYPQSQAAHDMQGMANFLSAQAGLIEAG